MCVFGKFENPSSERVDSVRGGGLRRCLVLQDLSFSLKNTGGKETLGMKEG